MEDPELKKKELRGFKIKDMVKDYAHETAMKESQLKMKKILENRMKGQLVTFIRDERRIRI